MIDQSKPPLAELAHVGVKGMKWGVRKERPTSAQIYAARGRIDGQRTKLKRADKSAARISNEAARNRALKKVGKQKLDFLKNPDRVTAAHLTILDAAFVMFFTAPSGGLFGAGILGARSAATARIASKQETGEYDKRYKRGQRLGI